MVVDVGEAVGDVVVGVGVGWLCATWSVTGEPLGTTVPAFGLSPTTVPGVDPALAGTYVSV